jgi:hypothetical protein
MSDSSHKAPTTFYPHQAVAYIAILKVWGLTGAMIAGLLLGQSHIPTELHPFSNGAALALFLGSLLFALHRLLHYSHTYLSITDDALIYRQGWIPSNTDNVFWINIKDINTSASVTESLLNTGSIIIIIAIRTSIYQIRISYLPYHENIATEIRRYVGALNQDARQVTYT